MKYRGRTEILGNILDAANGGVSRTKIIANFQLSLSYGQLKEYLSILIDNNLIEYLDGDNKFNTTEKELNFLKMHNQIEELLQVTQLKMNNNLIIFDILKHTILINSIFV